ncbi:MAG TPA: glycoside hydrolase family 25 protein [Thermoanaerobaculia bacterium]|jgi:lysozyme|nr:glycoside hydrolase family 25 protein [Thermoanaerobaculia bacterium]
MEAESFPGLGSTQGIDVSHYQGTIDWRQVADTGKRFAFIKATEGTSETDPQFQANWRGANVAGLLRGAYHFYQPGEDPQQQAKNFLSVVQPGPGDLPPVLDVELSGKPSEIISGIWVWLTAVEQATGKTPILYTNPSFWADLGAVGFGRFPLWIADYDVAVPTVPEGWISWSFWQFSESGSVSGVEGPVDLDIFQGTLMNLQRMAR